MRIMKFARFTVAAAKGQVICYTQIWRYQSTTKYQRCADKKFAGPQTVGDMAEVHRDLKPENILLTSKAELVAETGWAVWGE